MITIVIPTRNRAYTLIKVSKSYYVQKYVDEIIFVDDNSDDDTYRVVESIRQKYEHIETKYIKHDNRRGASACRITGYSIAKNDYILFGEDDAYLEENYTSKLLKKLQLKRNHGLVSGRIIYLLPQESQQNGLCRFGAGFEKKPYLNKISFSLNQNANIKGDFYVPFTHALFLTTKELLNKYPYDPFYAKGNGFREETDFQLNLFVNNYELLVTNETHCFHLNGKDVPSGGQRTSRLAKLYWNMTYTNYMYDKYFDNFKRKLGIKYSKNSAKMLFAMEQLNKLYIRPVCKLPFYFLGKLFK